MQTVRKVFGPPGCGKTHRLLSIMEEEMARGVDPRKIAFLSFTRRARHEAITRAHERFGYSAGQLPYFKTLHAIAFQTLGVPGSALISKPAQLAALGELTGYEFTLRYRSLEEVMETPAGGLLGDRLLMLDSLRRNRLTTIEATLTALADDEITLYMARHFTAQYQLWKSSEGLRDFSDLLELVEEPIAVEVAILDEAQDLSRLQWQTFHRLTATAARVYIAGDDDQAIFDWAGADAASFIEHPGAVEVLGQSYRSPRSVHALANRVSRRLRVRQPKTWAPRDHDGAIHHVDQWESVSIPQTGSVLVLYRNHFMARDIEDDLQERGIPYSRNEQPAKALAWGPAIVAWERLRKGKELTLAEVERVYDAIPVGRGIERGGKAAFNRMPPGARFTYISLREHFGLSVPHTARWFEALLRLPDEEIQYLRAVINHGGSRGLLAEPRVKLSTVHAAKGAQADHVFLFTALSRRSREALDRDPDAERRVFYVGVTRARDTLTLVGPDSSPFL